MKPVRITLVAVLVILAAVRAPDTNAHEAGGDIVFHVVNLPPIICVKDQKLDCVVGKLVDRACAIAELRYSFDERPWLRAEQELKHDPATGFFLVSGVDDRTGAMAPFFNLFSDDIWLFAVRPIDPDRLSDFKSVGVRRGSPFERPDLHYGLSVSPFNDWPYVAAMLGSSHLDGILAARAVILENVASKSPLQGQAQFHLVLGSATWSIVRAADAPSSAVTARFREGLEKAVREDWYIDLVKSYGLRL